MQAAEGPNLAPDAATTRSTVDTSNAVALQGYLGEGESDQSRRLYETLAKNRWIEILVDDFVDRIAADGGDDPTAGQSVVWVRRDATLTSCESVRASSYDTPPDGGAPPIPGKVWPKPTAP